MVGCSVGVMTEPDCLGPCEPGTGVVLEAVIWHESDSGMLVVNVTWKGRKYVGTLLDSSVHEWAPPSFRPDSPSRQQEMDASTASPQKRKTRRGRGARKTIQVIPSIPRTWGGDFKPHRSNLQDLANETRPEKRARCDVECPEQKCSKKFRCHNALEYHRIHAHVDNEIESTTTSKAKSITKQTRGIQTQTCSDELQNKPTALQTVNTLNGAENQNVTLHQDNQMTCSLPVNTATNKSSGESTENVDSSNNMTGVNVPRIVPPNSVASMFAGKGNSNFTNTSTTQSGKLLQIFTSPKPSLVSGTVRPMVNTKPDAKKGTAPIAVLRPLVPQHVSKLCVDKTIASVTTPTHTLSISCAQPQYSGVRPIQGVCATVMATTTAFTKPVTPGPNVPRPPLAQQTLKGSTAQRSQMEGPKFNTGGSGQVDSFKVHTAPSGAAVSHRRDSGKASHRGSRSNSMTSPNYSDISDASDGDMEIDTSQNELAPRVNGEVEGNEGRETQSAEERLYCNEELPSPSNTPGVKDNESATSPVKKQSNVSVSSHQSSAPNVQGETSRQSVPLHAVPPPQHIMYPYFPFMPNSQLNSVPMSAGAPLYAPSPYFMTYQGYPVMPAQGHPGMPQQMAPGQGFVTLGNTQTQVPKTKPN